MKPIECAMLMLQMGTHKLILLFYYNKCKSIFFIFLHLTFTIRFLRNRKIIKIKQTVWVLYGCFFFFYGNYALLGKYFENPRRKWWLFSRSEGSSCSFEKIQTFFTDIKTCKAFCYWSTPKQVVIVLGAPCVMHSLF